MFVRIAFLFTSILLLAGCGSQPNQQDYSLMGSWKLQDVKVSEKNTAGGDPLLQEAESKEAVKTGLSLSIFEDGTYSEVTGNGFYKTGKWKYVDASKQTIKAGTDYQLTIIPGNSTTPNAVVGINNNGDQLSFVQSARPLKNYREDPFYPSNNLWREKTKDEQDALRLKLANYFQHLSYVLKASKERKQSVVSFEFSQGLVRIYNGGIGILPSVYVPQQWAELFENQDAETHAYQMFQNYLNKSSYRGASKGDWVEDDYNILVSIYADFKKGNI